MAAMQMQTEPQEFGRWGQPVSAHEFGKYWPQASALEFGRWGQPVPAQQFGKTWPIVDQGWRSPQLPSAPGGSRFLH